MNHNNQIKIDNSYESAIKDGKWKAPGKELYDEIIKLGNSKKIKKLLDEIWLSHEKEHIPSNDERYYIPFTTANCKYPHHVISKGKLVLSIPGVKAAYMRACQTGVIKDSKVKNHLKKHFKELNLEMNEKLLAECKIEENMNGLLDYLGISLNEDYSENELPNTLDKALDNIENIVYNENNMEDLSNNGKQILKNNTVKYENVNSFTNLFTWMDNIQNGYKNNENKIITLIYEYASMNMIHPSYEKINKIFRDLYTKYRLQSPMELLESKNGLLPDKIEFLREYCIENNINFDIYNIQLEKSLNKENHSILVIYENDNFYWVENNWDKYKGIYEYSDLYHLLADINFKFKSSHKYNGKSVIHRLDNIPKFGISYNEYLDYINEQEIIELNELKEFSNIDDLNEYSLNKNYSENNMEYFTEMKTKVEYALERFKKKYNYDDKTKTMIVDGKEYYVNLDIKDPYIRNVFGKVPKQISVMLSRDNKYVVILPKMFFELKDDNRRDAILHHELGHINPVKVNMSLKEYEKGGHINIDEFLADINSINKVDVKYWKRGLRESLHKTAKSIIDNLNKFSIDDLTKIYTQLTLNKIPAFEEFDKYKEFVNRNKDKVIKKIIAIANTRNTDDYLTRLKVIEKYLSAGGKKLLMEYTNFDDLYEAPDIIPIQSGNESSKSLDNKSHNYFYHIISKDFNDDKITSLEYQYHHDKKLYHENSEKYRDRLCYGWNIYPDREPDDLTDDEVHEGINKFRKSEDGCNQIYFFKYPPYRRLGFKITSIMNEHKIYRIDINDPRIKDYIKYIDWGFDFSTPNDDRLNKEYYLNVTPKEYFSKYDDNNENMPVFAFFNHISIVFKDGYLPIKLCKEIPTPNTLEDVISIESKNENINESKEYSKPFEEIKTPEELLKWMSPIKYGWIDKFGKANYDSNGYDMDKHYKLQSAEEVAKNKIGICWDQCILEKAWFDQTIGCKIYFIDLYSDEFYHQTHSFIVYQENGKYIWFEHSWDKFRGIHKYKSFNDLMEDVKKKFSDYYKKKDKINKFKHIFISEITNVKPGLTAQEYMKYAYKKGKPIHEHHEGKLELPKDDPINESLRMIEEFDLNKIYLEVGENDSDKTVTDQTTVNDEVEDNKESFPKKIDKAESNKNGVRRKALYIAFIEWSKKYDHRNTFSSLFDKDIFHQTFPFVPESMRYFYRLANPQRCVLAGNLTFFPVNRLKEVNSKNTKLSEMMIFASTLEDLRIFNIKDGKVYKGKEENNNIVLGDLLSNSFDLYLQSMIAQGDILNKPLNENTIGI